MKDGITDLEKKIPSNEEHENFQTFEKIVNRETTKADAPLAICLLYTSDAADE